MKNRIIGTFIVCISIFILFKLYSNKWVIINEKFATTTIQSVDIINDRCVISTEKCIYVFHNIRNNEYYLCATSQKGQSIQYTYSKWFLETGPYADDLSKRNYAGVGCTPIK